MKFKDWIFEVDFDRTVEVYKSMVAGGPECCNCNNCKNFAEHRETIYPNLIKNLLSDLANVVLRIITQTVALFFWD